LASHALGEGSTNLANGRQVLAGPCQPLLMAAGRCRKRKKKKKIKENLDKNALDR